MERILYVWAIRHPTCGYVQGINDLLTPFYEVFLSSYIGTEALVLSPLLVPLCLMIYSFTDTDPEEFDPALLPPDMLTAVEADSFWCLSRLLDGIQDNYIAGQPGIQRNVKRMRELVGRIDRMLHFKDAHHRRYSFAHILPLFVAALAAHLDSQNVEFMQFAFRWMNCLLMREISVMNTIRMWDTYLVKLLVGG